MDRSATGEHLGHNSGARSQFSYMVAGCEDEREAGKPASNQYNVSKKNIHTLCSVSVLVTLIFHGTESRYRQRDGKFAVEVWI